MAKFDHHLAEKCAGSGVKTGQLVRRVLDVCVAPAPSAHSSTAEACQQASVYLGRS